MKTQISILLSMLLLLQCSNKSNHKKESIKTIVKIACNEKGCIGTYTGQEFIGNADIAHQFSNKMCDTVGKKLKVLYNNNTYVKVDFSNIKMSTKGMGTGHVIYHLEIPFVLVADPCDAFTSFDHVGGWNHTPELEKRKAQLSSVLLDGDTLNISDLKTTPEGLQEYWIQWKNKDLQKKCK